MKCVFVCIFCLLRRVRAGIAFAKNIIDSSMIPLVRVLIMAALFEQLIIHERFVSVWKQHHKI